MISLKDSIINALKEENSSHQDIDSSPSKPIKAREFNYLDIKRTSSWSVPSSVFRWNCRQFAVYILNSYKEKYKEEWDLKVVGIVTQINAIKQEVSQINGFCDNIVLKDYIDFYFKNWADYFRKNDPNKSNFLNFVTMKMQRPISEFSECYNYSNRLKYYQKYNGLPAFDIKNMDKLYSSDIVEFVKSYSFIIAINFMLTYKGLDKQLVMKKVGSVMLTIYKEDKIAFNNMMIRAEEFSPYPQHFVFKKENKFLSVLFKDYDVDPVKVKYSFDSIDWEFLKKTD